MIGSGSTATTAGRKRSGVSLIEATVSLALAAMLMIPVVGLLKTNRELWERSDSDRLRIDSVHGLLRHLSRRLRSADTVLSLQSQGRRPASLQIRSPDGQTLSWNHVKRTEHVSFDSGRGRGILADHISKLTFEGFLPNGQPTSDVTRMQTIRCTATTILTGRKNAEKTVECTVWLRPGF